MKIETIKFPGNTNETGSLIFLEGSQSVPFEIKRIYYIFDVAEGARRGFHAHKKLQQVLICVKGCCKVLLDDGKEREDVSLDHPSIGLVVGNAVWREMYDFSADAVLLVLASEHYDESDYIRNYNDFQRYMQFGEK